MAARYTDPAEPNKYCRLRGIQHFASLHSTEMSVSVTEADMEASLNVLQCHFTWGIDKTDIVDLKNISEKILDRIKSCHARCHPIYFNILADIVDLKNISENLLDRIKFCHARCHPIYFNILAFISHLQGDSDIALGFLYKAENLLRKRKDDTELLVTYGNYAWIHYHAKNMAEANVYLKKLEEIYQAHPKASGNPCDLPIIHGEKGWTFLRLGANFYQRARDSFKKALEGAPESESFNVGYAVVLFRLEGMEKEGARWRGESKVGEAIGQLRKALELEPDNAEVMVLLALKLQSQSTGTQESRDLVKQALSLAPDVPQVTRYAAKFFRMEGSIGQSLELLRKALELAPNSSFLHHQVGLCHKQQLIQMQEQGRGGPGGFGGRRPAGGGTPMAKVKAKADECILHFSRAVEFKPSNIYASVNLAEAYAEGRQMEKATEIYLSLEKDQSLREGDRQYVLCSYGLFLLYKQKIEGAAVAQLKAAYQIPVQGAGRERAGRKLRMLAERWDKQKPRDAKDILTFLADQDKLERERLTTERKADARE